jgi:hypothetical protein
MLTIALLLSSQTNTLNFFEEDDIYVVYSLTECTILCGWNAEQRAYNSSVGSSNPGAAEDTCE